MGTGDVLHPRYPGYVTPLKKSRYKLDQRLISDRISQKREQLYGRDRIKDYKNFNV
jgi:hypothetical protein